VRSSIRGEAGFDDELDAPAGTVFETGQ